MTEELHPYRMTVDLNVLDHLADGHYSFTAVVTEAVANAWDADAHEVGIDVNLVGDEIRMANDGMGMDRDVVESRPEVDPEKWTV